MNYRVLVKAKYLIGIGIVLVSIALLVFHNNSLNRYQRDYTAQVQALDGHASAADFPKVCTAEGSDRSSGDHYNIYCGGSVDGKLIATAHDPMHVKDLFTKLSKVAKNEGYKVTSYDLNQADASKRINFSASNGDCSVDVYYAPENQDVTADNGNAPPPFDYTKNINYSLECSYKLKSNLSGSFQNAKCSTSGVQLPRGYKCKE